MCAYLWKVPRNGYMSASHTVLSHSPRLTCNQISETGNLFHVSRAMVKDIYLVFSFPPQHAPNLLYPDVAAVKPADPFKATWQSFPSSFKLNCKVGNILVLQVKTFISVLHPCVLTPLRQTETLRKCSPASLLFTKASDQI